MSFIIKDLRDASDEEIIRLHDAVAVHTSVGAGYYLDELQRRDQQRSAESTERLARAAVRLTFVSTGVAILALVVSVLALLR